MQMERVFGSRWIFELKEGCLMRPTDRSPDNAKFSAFPETRWSLVDALKMCAKADADYRCHLLEDLLVDKEKEYRAPLLAYARRLGLQEADAEDQVHDFLLRLCHGKIIAEYDREKGRFRFFLKRCLRNQVSNFRRNRLRKDQRNVSLDEAAESFADLQGAENDFDREWVRMLVREAISKLKTECQINNKTLHYSLLNRRFIEPLLNDTEAPSVNVLVREFGLGNNGQAYNRLATATRMFQKHLMRAIRFYTETPEEFADEVRLVFGKLWIKNTPLMGDGGRKTPDDKFGKKSN
jgi:RNA polymerase sigma factor (sigma-70 family)